jgi:hypothetical protein
MAKIITQTPYRFIVIENDNLINPYFAHTALEALAEIARKPVGRSLLDATSAANIAPHPQQGFKVKLIRGMGVEAASIANPGKEGGSRAVPFNEIWARGGAGSKAACYWNPNIFNTPASGKRPAFIGLAHELVHCMHSVMGTMKATYDDEEKWTIGLDPYADAAICENTIREEHGEDKRTRYDPPPV